MKKIVLPIFLIIFCFYTTLSAQQTNTIGPVSYPDAINPLTGLPVPDATRLTRRPLVIKISNYPPFVRDLQRGLMDAEIVWEHLLAGGVTRFSAVFLNADLEQVGPIRSARLVDFHLTRIYDGLFTYSGMAQGTIDRMVQDRFVSNRVIGGSGPCPALCRYPQEEVAQEHTLYGNTPALRELAIERERDVATPVLGGMAFSPAPLAQGTDVSRLILRYRGTTVEWAWSAEANRWLRFQDNLPHMDTAQAVQLSANNVLIFEAEHQIMPEVADQYWGPPNFAFDVNFIGEGRVFLLRDGQFVEGRWQRASDQAPLTFVDLQGNVLAFHEGNTFVNLVPLWIDGYEIELITNDAPRVTINGEIGVNMYHGPNNLYSSPDVAYPGDTFRAIGRNWNGTWLQLKRGQERAIWISAEHLDLGTLDAMTLPLVRPANERG